MLDVFAENIAALEDAYSWEHSIDRSTWTPLPEALKTRVEVSDLKSAQTYYCRGNRAAGGSSSVCTGIEWQSLSGQERAG